MCHVRSTAEGVDGVPANNHSIEMRSGFVGGSYLRLIDSCITQLKAQGPSRTCDESNEEVKKRPSGRLPPPPPPHPGVGQTLVSKFKNKHFTEMCCGTEAGSYLRLIDSCITQRKAEGPARTCNESKEEE